MSKFKVGERVAIYEGSLRRVVRITSIEARGEQTCFVCTQPGNIGTIFVNKKQCRKLVKKPRRRIWLNPDWVDDHKTARLIHCREEPRLKDIPELVEFVEVRKRK